MRDLFERMYEDMYKVAEKNNVSMSKAFGVFIHAYDKHKAQHGSFKGHPEYNDAMEGRYRYMRDQAIKYINSEVKKREADKGDLTDKL